MRYLDSSLIVGGKVTYRQLLDGILDDVSAELALIENDNLCRRCLRGFNEILIVGVMFRIPED